MADGVLFLCTGNACRSQMAEGFARAMADDRLVIHSAGINPQGLDSRAVAVMAESGVDISRQYSKMLDESVLEQVSLVVTLCGDANERCPLLPPGTERRHWALPDPARAEGDHAAIDDLFRQVRDQIRVAVFHLLTHYFQIQTKTIDQV